ncbi:MAG: DUF2080 family transposase-associated protein [Thermoplasmata archaeon]
MVTAAGQERTQLKVEGISAVFEKVVTSFGNGAKIDCPKSYLGRRVFVVVRRESEDRATDESDPTDAASPARAG